MPDFVPVYVILEQSSWSVATGTIISRIYICEGIHKV